MARQRWTKVALTLPLVILNGSKLFAASRYSSCPLVPAFTSGDSSSDILDRWNLHLARQHFCGLPGIRSLAINWWQIFLDFQLRLSHPLGAPVAADFHSTIRSSHFNSMQPISFNRYLHKIQSDAYDIELFLEQFTRDPV